jgi:hypothetical protein
MRLVSLLVIFGFIASNGFALRAAEAPSAEYAAAMKTLGGAVQGLMKPGGFEEFEAAQKAATDVKAAFAVVDKYWKAKGDTEAVSLVAAGIKAAGDLGVVAGMTSSEGIEAAAKDIAATCAPCHKAHREKVGDGFQIK